MTCLVGRPSMFAEGEGRDQEEGLPSMETPATHELA